MQKVSFPFLPESMDQLEWERGTLSRNQFAQRLMTWALREHEEQTLHRMTALAYGDAGFASEEERLTEDFFDIAPEPEQLTSDV